MVYFSLTGLYSLYLNNTQEKEAIFACAPITKTVTEHSKKVAELLGYNIETEQNLDELSLQFRIDGNYVVKIVEGCTSVSIMILFLAFIIAFSGSVKATILYGIFGAILIYAANIFRIVALAIIIYHYPAYQGIMHSLFFPAVIYGMVFLLWIVWVNKFAKKIKKKG